MDVTSLDVIDSFSNADIAEPGRHAPASRRRSKAVIAGIQPAVAMAMVELGLHMTDVRTVLDLEAGLAYLRAGPHRTVDRGR